jgi:diguanylate cyclase (GGDEF)-like protein
MHVTAERHLPVSAALRGRAVVMAMLGLLVVLGVLAFFIVFSQQQSKARMNTNFGMRATSSATVVSTYLTQQAAREQQDALEFLAARHVSRQRFAIVVGAFGSQAAVLLDAKGRLLDVVPAKPSLLGQPIASRYAHLAAAERGAVAVSNVVPSAAEGTPVTAVAVPFSTPEGRRVFSAAYPTSGAALEALVEHTMTYPEHEVFLVDASGRLIAASPRTGAVTLAAVDPTLARDLRSSSGGAVKGAPTPSRFTVADVPGTPWRLVVAVPNSRLYASIGGWTSLLPWLVFALVGILGMMLIALFARSQADRARLAILSVEAARTARTDTLTGLPNRRALSEQLTRATAHARRRDEPVSVLMIDLDRFKDTNDRFGHEAGDQVLCALADCMREVLRAEDLYGRWGGDEFLVALPATDETGARAAVVRIREAADNVELGDVGLSRGVPLSAGSATGVHASPRDLIREADLALYAEKATRRESSQSTTGRA